MFVWWEDDSRRVRQSHKLWWIWRASRGSSPRRTSRSWPGWRSMLGGSGLKRGNLPCILSLVLPHPRNCTSLSYQEHPFFTLHKTKKTDIAAFVKEILGEDS